VTPDLAITWEHIRGELRRATSATTYDVWLDPLRAVSHEGSTLRVEAPAEIRAWVADRYGAALTRAAAAILGGGVTVEVVDRGIDAQPTAAGAARDRARHTPAPVVEPEVAEPELNPKFSFDQFVIGDGNRFAHAAALAVAELPGQAYNPLFVYGPPGVGKTHLLHAIGNYARDHATGLNIRCTTVERFTDDFVAALHAGGRAIDRFKGRYRHNDVLLIDDVQFLESRAKTEQEFFHTFNALMETGAQVVVTSDRTPGDLDGMHQRLRERFAAGLVTDIASPDLATRLTVLRKRAQHDGVAVGADVLDAIATRVTTNIRALEAAFIRVVAFASLTGRTLSVDLAAEVLDGLYPRERDRFRTARQVTISDVQRVVCDAFGLTEDELVAPGRSARVTWPRQLGMWLAREQTSETLPAIGREFGGRNHTTVMHALKRTAERLASDPEAHELAARLAHELRGGGAGSRAVRPD
jgi:chromosomal replication initiator protein